MFALAKIVKRIRLQGTRGMAPCILLSFPILHGILFPWTSLSLSQSQKDAPQYRLSLTVSQKWHTSYPSSRNKRQRKVVQNFSCRTYGDYMDSPLISLAIETLCSPVHFGQR